MQQAVQLSNEDALRLNVLLRQPLHAVRINESAMSLYALTDKGEVKCQLNPNCRADRYVRAVRELLSSHVLGSPGGYPVFLQRWTRMGEVKGDKLSALLCIGEPEAVVAVVHARALTVEQAANAWWALPNSENARQLLKHQNIVTAPIGRELAEFLLEFLPFEEDPYAAVESIRLLLQPGLISADEKKNLWSKAKRRVSYYVGFLKTCADDLPEQFCAHSHLIALRESLADLLQVQNPYAQLWLKLHDAPGQGFIEVMGRALEKIANQDSTVALFEALDDYFTLEGHRNKPARSWEEVEAAAQQELQYPAVQALLHAQPQQMEAVFALCCLLNSSHALLTPVFSKTDAVGSVMRDKLAPVTDPLLRTLRNVLLC